MAGDRVMMTVFDSFSPARNGWTPGMESLPKLKIAERTSFPARGVCEVLQKCYKSYISFIQTKLEDVKNILFISHGSSAVLV